MGSLLIKAGRVYDGAAEQALDRPILNFRAMFYIAAILGWRR